jgi:hypothetical protein
LDDMRNSVHEGSGDFQSIRLLIEEVLGSHILCPGDNLSVFQVQLQPYHAWLTLVDWIFKKVSRSFHRTRGTV